MAIKLYQKAKQEASFWLGRRLPACEQLIMTMSESLERELTWREYIKMRLHFIICVYCQRYLKQLRLMRETALACSPDEDRNNLPSATLSNEARERLKRALEERG